MSDSRILIVDDDDITREMLREIVKNDGYTPVLASNGKEAMELIRKEPFLVIITDIEMPVMDGNELIAQIRELDGDTVIIVLTGHSELNLVIDIMKKGVYDYIIKPVESGEIVIKLRRAFETAHLRSVVKIRENERLAKLENQLEWFKWNEQILKRDYDRIDSTLFKSLHMSFNQGAGFGTILTLIQMISSTAIREGKHYLIDSEIFDLIRLSGDLALKTIETFGLINKIVSNTFELKRMTLSELHGTLQSIAEKLSRYRQMKSHAVLISSSKSVFSEKEILIEPAYFEVSFQELLMNAFKFSRSGSKITVILDIVGANAELSVISDPEPLPGKIIGIPKEYESLVFEPFFRMANTVHENYNTLDFGLGLVVVEKIISKHGGSVKASNVRDHSDIGTDPVVKVDFTAVLPLAQG